MLNQFSRTQLLLGRCAMEALTASRVAVFGIYQPYIDGEKEISQINAEYRAPFVRG